MSFIERIINWNKARYEQEHNKLLTASLLLEEVHEYGDATNKIEELDALVDTVYVALGAMWKMGLTEVQIENAILAVCDSNDSKSIVKTAAHIKTNINKGTEYVSPTEDLTQIMKEVENARQK